MGQRVLKALLLSFLIYIILALGVVASTGISIHLTGKEVYSRLLAAHRNRIDSLGLLLSKLASEEFEPQRMVSISSAAEELVLHSRQNKEDVRINEIYILDRDRRVLAHNDANLVARDAGLAFKGKIYDEIFNATREKPLLFEATNFSKPPKDWFRQQIFEYIKLVYPELAADRFHLGVAIFRVDFDRPEAAIHLLLTNRLAAAIVDSTIRTATAALVWGLGISGVIAVLIFLILIVVQNSVPAAPGVLRQAKESRKEGREKRERERERVVSIDSAREAKLQTRDRDKEKDRKRGERGRDRWTEEEIDDIEPIPEGNFDVGFSGSSRIVDAIPLNGDRRRARS